MEGRRKGTTVEAGAGGKWKEMGFPSQVCLFQNGMTAADGEGFSEAPYLAAEFAVLKAMQGEETIRDVNNRQSRQSRGTEERGKLILH